MLQNNIKTKAQIALFSGLCLVQLAHAQSLGARPVIAGTLDSVLPQADGSVYLSGGQGDLRAIPLLTANAVRIRMDNPGTAVPFFQGTGFDGPVSAALADAKVPGAFFYGGDFGSFNQQPGTQRLVKIKVDGTRDASFGVGQGFDAAVMRLAQADDGSGDLWVAGSFTKFDGHAVASGLVRVSASGKFVAAPDLSKSWQFTGDSAPTQVQSLLATADGSGGVIVGSTAGMLRLSQSGAVDPHFSVPIPFFQQRVSINALVRTDGGILVGGSFDTNNTAKNLIKIKETGELDPSFEDGSGTDGEVLQISIAQDSSDMIYVLGQFAHYDGNAAPAQSSIARVNPNGLLDLSFKADFIGAHAIQTLPNGNIAVAASAQAIPGPNDFRKGGFTTAELAVLDPTGARLPGFNKFTIESDREITTLVPMPDGSLVLGGTFTYYGPTTQLPTLAHLNADGSLDTGFEQNLSWLTQPYGSVLVWQLTGSLTNPKLFFALGTQFFSFDQHGNKVSDPTQQIYTGSGTLLTAVDDGTLVSYTEKSLYFFHPDLTPLNGFKLRKFEKTIDSDSTNEEEGTINSVVDAGQDDGSVWVSGTFNYYDKSKTGSLVRLDQNGDVQDRVERLHDSSRISSSPDQQTFWIDNYSNNQFTLNRMDNDGSIRKSFTPSIPCYEYFKIRELLSANDGSVYLLAACEDADGKETSQAFQHFHSDGTEDKDFVTRVAAGDGRITAVAQVPKSSDLVVIGTFTQFGSPSFYRAGITRIRADGSMIQ